MHIKTSAVLWLLVPAYWIVMPVPSFASSICWIDHIAKANKGVNIYFIQKAALRIGVAGNSSGGTAIVYTVSNGVVRTQDGKVQDHLFVKDGGAFYARQMVEDSCSYTVSIEEGVGKAAVTSAMHMPGLQPSITKQIIGTDGTVSRTEVTSGSP